MDFLKLCSCVCHLFFLGVQVVWAVDEVTLLNPPEEPVPDHALDILYSCDEPGTVQLDCIVSFDTGITSTHLLRQWRCFPGDPRTRSLELNLPDWLVYQADGTVTDSQWVLSCFLRASLRHDGFDDTEDESVAAEDFAMLQPKAYFRRPFKRHRLCFPWSSEILKLTHQFLNKQCPIEEETVTLLSSIFSSTGENFGITKTLEPYGSEVLEHFRVKAVSKPWCSFSVWLFVSTRCQGRLCSVFHHINSEDNYISPSLFLKQSGQLHMQMNGESGDSSAFLSTFKVPLHQWCRISVRFQGRRVILSMVCVEKEQRTVRSAEDVLSHDVRLDDTEGYFVIGGGKHVEGVEGYFGPMVYYRNRFPPHSLRDAVVPDVLQALDLTGWLQTCEEFRLEVNVKISGYALKAQQIESGKACFDAFHKWLIKDKLPLNPQCEPWEKSVPRRRQAAKLSKLFALKHGGRRVSSAAVGRALFSLSLRKLDRASSSSVVSTVLPLLLQAGCLADNRALRMSSVLYSSGLGVEKQLSKAWLLALVAAQRDDRLAHLHLGHRHHGGLHGLPTDPDLAYAYYANIAKQTTLDKLSPTPEQTFVEAVYLNNDEVMSLQTNENHHTFQWLKLQARRGASEAEQALARMLFWGQRGVTPDIQQAVRHYQRGAVRGGDPEAMYDYGIVLLQGHGVEQDVPKAVTFLKKAMDKGFVPAINALAWYHEQFEHDYTRAVQLWEQADLLECPDAALNLGVMHSQGLYPGKPANQFMAYKYYLKSAERGHIRGALLLADAWTTGLPGFVSRRPADAVLWVKWAAEKNGHLGSVLRKALDSYLRGDMFSSLLHYMMAAECGYAAAQFNVAYLCEQNAGRFLDPAFALQCMWRYYNLTIQSQNPDSYALIRMGDLLYDGQLDRQKDLFSAAEMYKRAALRNEPQGWHNLGLLAEEGHRLPLSVLTELGLSELYLADRSLLLSALYKRCRDSEDTHSYLPCSLALFNVHLQMFQRDYSAAIKFSAAVAVVAAPTIFFLTLGVFRRRVLSQQEAVHGAMPAGSWSTVGSRAVPVGVPSSTSRLLLILFGLLLDARGQAVIRYSWCRKSYFRRHPSGSYRSTRR
ncbi:protein sel-1 homolog 3 [Limanda limanda]|uniref:protein sel-1 homolog 3 n=1 Tax=Limanda limanda TaxID=27771 RepID=UPI0029C5FD9D|nr:protein sel-1 homolog 3 [Limanda limanda]